MAGEEQRTRVYYQAIADFSQLSRAARAARRDLRELREEEARGNAESAAGSQRAERARDRNTRSVSQNVDAANRSTDASTRAARATREHAQETERSAGSLQNMAQAARGSSAATSTLSSVVSAAQSRMQSLSNSTDRNASSQSRNTNEVRRSGNAMRSTMDQAERLNRSLIKIGNWRPRLMPPFIALIPIIGALLALINPLAAGLGAVGIAAFGMAGNLASVAGAALGAIPALASLLSVVGALKIAFGGVGSAFKAYGNAKKATGGGGAATPAESNRAELTQAEQLERAWDRYRRAIEDVGYAQEDLDEARAGYTKRLDDLRKAVDRAALSEQRAAANSQLARENYANVLADPGSTKGQKMEAKAALDEARNDIKDVQDENKQNAADLTKLQKTGMEGDRQVVMAKRAVVDASRAVRDAELEIQNVGKGTQAQAAATAGAVNEFNDALSKLSPSAKQVVLALISMDGAWTKLKRNVQEAFFAPVVQDVKNLIQVFPALESMLVDTAGAAGRVASKLLKMVVSPQFKRDLVLLGKQNVPIIENLGDAFLSLLDIFRDLTIATGPFFIGLTQGLADGTKRFSEMVETARETGSLAAWLEKVNDRMAQWWRIIKNIGVTLFNYGAATSGLGQWVTDGFEEITKGWRDASELARQTGSPFQEYLENIKPLLVEVSGLFGDFFGWFAKTAQDPENITAFTTILESIRSDLGPALAHLLDVLAKSGIGDALVDAIVSIFEAIGLFLDNGGAEGLSAFWTTVSDLFEIFKDIIENTPEPVIEALAVAFATLAALRFFGLTSMLGLLLRVARNPAVRSLFSARGLAALGGRAQGAIDAAGAAVRGGAVGRGAALVGRAAVPAAVGAAAGWASNRFIKDGNGGSRDTGGSILGGIATGAGLGLAAGTVVPGLGNAVGAIGGGIIGGGAAALGIDKEQWSKTAEEISSWWSGTVVPAWTSVTQTISGWWNDYVIAPFALVGQTILNFWNDRVVTPFQTAAAQISAWWNENIVTPFVAVIDAIGRGWQVLVVEPFTLAAANIALWWNQFVVEPFKLAAANVALWWNQFVVEPFKLAAANVALWWNQFVVEPFKLAAANVAQWWNDSVVTPFRTAAANVSQWWNDSVVSPFRIAASNVSQWWNNNVVTPFGNVATNVKTAWDTYVINPFKTVISGIKTGWDNLTGGLSSSFNKIKNFDLSDSITGWANSLFRHNGGPVIKRSNGGGVGGRGNSDSVKAMLTPGEFVVRKAIVNRVGEDNLAKLNAGVLSYGAMLRNANANKASASLSSTAAPAEVQSPLFFNQGGLVPTGQRMGSRTPDLGGGGAGISIDKSFTVENLTIVNPVAEPSSDSLPNAIRKVAYMGSGVTA